MPHAYGEKPMHLRGLAATIAAGFGRAVGGGGGDGGLRGGTRAARGDPHLSSEAGQDDPSDRSRISPDGSSSFAPI
jgi:hypothetical protein